MNKKELRRVYVIEPKDGNTISRDLKTLRGIGEIANSGKLDVIVGDFEGYVAVLKYCEKEKVRMFATVGTLKDLQISIVDGSLSDYNRIAYIADESEFEEVGDFAEFLNRNEILTEVRQIY